MAKTPLETPIFKELKDVVGITSRIVYGKQRTGHWLMFDVDSMTDAAKCLKWIRLNFKRLNYTNNPTPLKFYATPHGFHFILFERHSLKHAYEILKLCPYVDQKWVEKGYKRRYWFLDTHGKRDFPKRVEYMKIKRAVAEYDLNDATERFDYEAEIVAKGKS